jgi:leucyl-tRNA synthetase
MLPYPSGDLHIGHWYAMAPSDAKARYHAHARLQRLLPHRLRRLRPAGRERRHQARHPPQEVDHGQHRAHASPTASMGAMWAWDREAITCRPRYYKWTQWFFLKLYEHGLAYRKKAPVDFCPTCNTTLAREQVWGEDRHCERCGTPVIKKELEQWFFRSPTTPRNCWTSADRLARAGRTMQTNWIGRSEGAEVTFNSEQEPRSRRDRRLHHPARHAVGRHLHGPGPGASAGGEADHPEPREAVAAYKYPGRRQSEIERLATEKEKTGVFIGAYAINPVNGERIPIWIADYVMMTYGTGAIMGVPAHDERDFAVRRSSSACPSSRSSTAVDRYVALVREHLRQGYWVDVVGAKWLFILRMTS